MPSPANHNDAVALGDDRVSRTAFGYYVFTPVGPGQSYATRDIAEIRKVVRRLRLIGLVSVGLMTVLITILFRQELYWFVKLSGFLLSLALVVAVDNWIIKASFAVPERFDSEAHGELLDHVPM